MENYDVIIIGSGPAGLTAAVYAARADFKTVVLGGQEYGGQLMKTTKVENFPGFPEGIHGPELMVRMVEQAKVQGADLVYKNVDKVDLSRETKKVWADNVEYSAPMVIIAVGSSPRKLGVPGEDSLLGKGVCTCATCDGAFYKDKIVAVIGGGDSAAEEATFLTRFAKKVYLIHRRDELRASKAMQERVSANEKIEVLWNTEVMKINGDTKVESLSLKNNAEKSTSDLKVDGIFLAIGHIPNSDFLGDQVEKDPKGFVVPKEYTHTSVPGVFVSGDVSDYRYQQAVTAAGMGCMAALDAEKWYELNRRG